MSRKVNVVFAGDMTKLRAAVIRARQTIRRFAIKAKAAMVSVARSIKNISFNALRVGAISATAAIAGLVGAGVKGVSLAADMETLTTSFEVLTGSAEVAKETIKSLDDLSNSTPLAPEDVISAGQQLIAFGENASTVTATIARLGDVSSGIGAPLGDIAEIYGKARVQGTLFSEDINQLAGRGVPIFESLASVMGVAAGEVKGMASKGKIGFAELEKAFVQMTGSGGKFEGMMAKQSSTFNGMLSTMFGKLRAKLRDVFTPVMDNLKPVLEAVISKIDAMTPQITAAATALGEVVKLAAEAFAQGKVFAIGGSLLKIALIEGANFLWKSIKGAVAFLASCLLGVIELSANLLKDTTFLDGLVAAFRAGARYIQAAAFDLMSAVVGGDEGLKNRADAYRGLAEMDVAIAKILFDRSGVGEGFVEVVQQAGTAAAQAFAGDGLIDSSKAKNELAAQISDLKEGLKKNTEQSTLSTLPANQPASTAATSAAKAEAVADSKARVGGGGRVFSADNRAHAEQRRQTSIQERTAKAAEKLVDKPVFNPVAVLA